MVRSSIGTDGRGDGRPVDQAALWARWAEHLATVAAVDPTPWPPPAAVRSAGDDRGRAVGARSGPGGDVLLWRALEASANLEGSGLDLEGEGPLWSRDGWAAVEVWTEAELSGLHALHRAARLRPDERLPLRARLASALAWHIEHTQPDNATNRPWAIHVFLLSGHPEGSLYAETLLHNAMVQGIDDPASRWILADAARELRAVGHPAD
jgi:hypothetical protein